LNDIRAALSAIDGNPAMDEINETGVLKLNLASGEVIWKRRSSYRNRPGRGICLGK
jgi:hypothetical protein